MICECYDMDGQLVTHGSVSLLTKSLYRATIDAQEITGLPLKMIASSFAVMGKGKKRLLVSVQDGN